MSFISGYASWAKISPEMLGYRDDPVTLGEYVGHSDQVLVTLTGVGN